jgi:hypothetical protein
MSRRPRRKAGREVQLPDRPSGERFGLAIRGLSVLYHAPRLIISGPHELWHPTARWAVCPDQLQVAVVAADAELERFAGQIADALPSGSEAAPSLMGRKLAGLG